MSHSPDGGSSNREFRLLGSVDVRVDGEPVGGLAGTRAGFLLGYLAAERRRAHERGELTALLWPDEPEPRARANLRQMLYDLRRRLRASDDDPLIVSHGHSVALVPGPGDWLDLDVLDPAGIDEETTAAPVPAELPTVIALYRGPLLGRDVEAVLGDEALAWLSRRRATVREQARAVLDPLVREQFAGGNVDNALAHVRRYRDCEPFDEAANRLAMQLLADTGRPEEALEVFSDLERLLASQLGAAPAPRTCALRDRIRDGGEVPVEATDPTELPLETRRLTVAALRLSPSPAEPTEETALRMAGAREAVRAALVHHRAHIVDAHGGLVLAYFDYPGPLARSGERAADAALSARRGVEGGVAVTAVVHAGPAITGSDPDLPDPLGVVTDTVVRLSGSAPTGSVLVTEPVTTRFDFRYPTRSTAAVEAPVAAYPLTGRVAAASAPDAPLIGRDAERERLGRAWHAARAGRPATAFVQGEAGIGKTRLVNEIGQMAIGADQRVIRLQAVPGAGDRPFGPIVDFLRRRLRAPRRVQAGVDDDPRATLRSILDRDPDRDTLVDWLMWLLDGPRSREPAVRAADPIHVRNQLDAALTRLLAATVDARPTLLILEDVHWADASTLHWLRQLPGALPRAPLFVIATARTGTSAPWSGDALEDTLDLAPLAPDEADALIAHHTRDAPQDPTARRRLVEVAGGYPLFIEWLARSVTEMDSAQGTLPTTLADLLLVRLDRLGEARRVAEAAAILAEPLHRDDIAALAAADVADPDAALARLLEGGILRSTADRANGRYAWRHALYREVATSALTPERRRMLHGRAADTLLPRASASAAVRGRLAHHLEEAGRPADALPLRLQAGDEALAAGAVSEATLQFEQAVECARGSDAAGAPAIDARIGLGTAYLVAHGYGSAPVESAFRAALSIPGVERESLRYSRVLRGLWMCASSHHGFDEAFRLADALMVESRRSHDASITAAAHHARAVNALFAGPLDVAMTQGLEAGRCGDELDPAGLVTRYGEHLGLSGRAIGAWACLFADSPARARSLIHRACEQSDALDHAPTAGFVHAIDATIAQRMDDPAAAATAARAIGDRLGAADYPLWQGVAATFQEWVRVRLGETRDVTPLEAIVRRMDEVMAGSATPFRLVLADAQIRAGGLDAAHRTATAIDAGIERLGDTAMRADAHLLRARLHVAAGDPAAARAEYERAHAEAVHQRSPLRALEALAGTVLQAPAPAAEEIKALHAALRHYDDVPRSPHVDLQAAARLTT